MKAEIIAVGSELLLGDILNTNAQFLARQLAELGIDIYYQGVVGDNPERLQDVLATAVGRSEIIITTGGLGPTEDDLTKETICNAVGAELVLDEEVLAEITAFFEKIGGEMTDNNRKQAMVPKGATILHNENGTAPGIVLERAKQMIVMLPGPPSEMRPMFENQVKPILAKKSDGVIYSTALRFFGIGESSLETKLKKFVEQVNPSVALYAKPSEVLVRVTAKAASAEQAKEMCENQVKELRDLVGEYIYGQDVDSLEEAVVKQLIEKKLRIATAESCTGGWLAKKITGIAGASEIMDMSFVTYANRAKEELLEVPHKILEKYGAVSRKVAAFMAKGARKKSSADLALAITGIAGPDGGTEQKPVGLVFIALVDRDKVWVKKCELSGRQNTDRDEIRNKATLHALDMVRQYLNGTIDTVAEGFKVKDIKKIEDPISENHENVAKRFFKYLFPVKGDSGWEVVRKIVFLIAVVAFCISAYFLGSYIYGSFQNRREVDTLKDLYSQYESADTSNLPEGYAKRFAGLYAINQDVAGWLEIPGTGLSYPVVLSKDNEDYLRTGFSGQYSVYGTPFIDYRNSIKELSTNTIIYGHNMQDGQMFHNIVDYKDLSYYQQNPIINFNTVYEDEASWKIVGAFLTNTTTAYGDIFEYYNFINAQDEDAFNDFIAEVQKRSYIDTGVDVEYGDKLLTLSTCSYDLGKFSDGSTEGRFVVVARKVRDGEDKAVDVSLAKENKNPVIPQKVAATPQKPTVKPVAKPPVYTPGVGAETDLPELNDDLSGTVIGGGDSSSSGGSSSGSGDSSSSGGSSMVGDKLLVSARGTGMRSVFGLRSACFDIDVSGDSVTFTTYGYGHGVGLSQVGANGYANAGWNYEQILKHYYTGVQLSSKHTDTVSVAGETADTFEMLCRVVYNEIRDSYHPEAIKAQAIAAYSYILYYNDILGKTAPLSPAPAANVTDKLRDVVRTVLDQTVVYNGSVIQAVFFASSPGRTENSEDVWGGTLPYLRSVESAYEKPEDSKRTKTFSKNQTIALIQENYDLNLDPAHPEEWFQIQSKTQGGFTARVGITGYRP